MRNFKMLSLPFAGLVLGALCLGGCSPKTIDGKWSVTSDKFPAGISADGNFENGKYTLFAKVAQGLAAASISVEGTYTFKGDQLTLTPTTASVDDRMVPAPARPFFDPVKKQLAEDIGKTDTGTVRFDRNMAMFVGKDSKGVQFVMTFTRPTQ